MTLTTDEDLYRDARAGSSAAFAELYKRYESRLFGFLVRRLENRGDAEDIFHDAMLAILKGSQAQLTDGAFAPWLYKVALHLTSNRLRSRRREGRAKAAILHANRDQECHEQTSEQLIESELRTDLAFAARSLSHPLNDVYKLHLSGQSQKDIAKTLGVPLGTVKSRLHLLVVKLRKDLTKWIVK